MNSILITQPVGTLDGVVHVPSPVVLVHVSESRVDTTLGSDSVRSGREKLGDTSSVEASLGETEGSSQTGTTGTNNDGIVLVVLYNCQLTARRSMDGELRRTMTEYLLLTKGDASLALKGPLAITRAGGD